MNDRDKDLKTHMAIAPTSLHKRSRISFDAEAMIKQLPRKLVGDPSVPSELEYLHLPENEQRQARNLKDRISSLSEDARTKQVQLTLLEGLLKLDELSEETRKQFTELIRESDAETKSKIETIWTECVDQAQWNAHEDAFFIPEYAKNRVEIGKLLQNFRSGRLEKLTVEQLDKKLTGPNP